jgi:SAM-dependent methyltransferase
MRDSLTEAEAYDLFGYPETTSQDCDFLEDIFAMFGQNVQTLLDLGCGTGRHALEMGRRGFRVTGVDHAPEMLDRAAQQALAQNLPLTFIQQELAALNLGRRFDAAYLLYNTLCLLTSNEDLLRFFKGVHTSLKSDGLFILEVYNLWADIALGKVSNTTLRDGQERAGIKSIRETEITVGPYNNLLLVKNRQRFWRGDIQLAPASSTTTMRSFSPAELDLLCRLSQFRLLRLFGATDITSPILDPDRVEAAPDAYHSFVLVLSKNNH